MPKSGGNSNYKNSSGHGHHQRQFAGGHHKGQQTPEEMWHHEGSQPIIPQTSSNAAYQPIATTASGAPLICQTEANLKIETAKDKLQKISLDSTPNDSMIQNQ